MNKSTGLPSSCIKAWNAASIKDAIKRFDKNTIVQVIIAKANIFKAEPFMVGFFGTNNKFTGQDVMAKIVHIQAKLKSFGIKMLMYGSDGDTRCMMAQKQLTKYGSTYEFCGIKLAGSLDSNYFFSQDPFHIAKKMKNLLFDFGSDLILGDFIASLGFLLILNKKFGSEVTGLNQSDLDFRDRMNYK